MTEKEIKIVNFECGCQVIVSPDNRHRLHHCKLHQSAPFLRDRIAGLLSLLASRKFWRKLSTHPFVDPSILPNIEQMDRQIEKAEYWLDELQEFDLEWPYSKSIGEKRG